MEGFSSLPTDRLAAWYAEEPDDVVRKSLARRLLSDKATDPITAFDAMYSRERSAEVRCALLGSISSVRSETALHRVLSVANSGSPKERKCAISLLSQRNPDFAPGEREATLFACARDPDASVRSAALESLYRLAGPKHLAVFIHAASNDESSMVRLTAERLSHRAEADLRAGRHR
jgi:HEAT repeat protein